MKHLRFEPAASSNQGFFEKKDPWGHGFALWVVAAILFLLPVSLIALKKLELNNDVQSWLPQEDPSAVEFAWCRKHFPERETIVLTWDGSTLDDPRLPLVVSRLTGTPSGDGIIRNGNPYVSSVLHAGDIVRQMIERGVDETEAVRRLEGTFLGRGYLKVRLTESGRENVERTSQLLVAAARQELGIDIQVYPAVTVWSPSADQEETFHKAVEQIPPSAANEELMPIAIPEHDLRVGWDGIASSTEQQERFCSLAARFRNSHGIPLVEKCFFSTGSPISLVITLSEAGKSEGKAAIASVRQAAIESFIPEDQVLLGGTLVSQVALNDGVAQAIFNPHAKEFYRKSVIGLSGLVGILFALLSLKSLRLGLLVVGVSYYSALVGMAIIPLTGSSVNMVLVVLPTLLMVLALSGAIHVANYWKFAVWENPVGAVDRATRMAWLPCALAAFTTALGLISLATSELMPVRSFGIYAAVGTILSVVMVLYGLPSLLQMVPLRRVQPDEINPRRWILFGEALASAWVPLMILTIGGSVALGYGLVHFKIETKVIKYFPTDSRIVGDYRQIENSLTGVVPVEIVVRFDSQAQKNLRFLERMEIVRMVEEEIRRHPDVSGTLSLASFQPRREAPGDDTGSREKIFYNRRSSETEKRCKTGQVTGAAEFLAEANTTPAGERLTGLDELWRINAQCGTLGDIDYDQLTADLSAGTAVVLKDIPGTEYLVTGTVPLFLRTQKAVLESLIWSFVMAFVLIAIVMVLALRDLLAGLISMIPNLLPVVSVFGLVSWCGQRIDIGTMVTASVALGIAVDGTLHLITWFQDGIRRGLSRKEAMVASLAHCGPAMWQTSAAVGIGLLVLYPADLLLISRFGWLMAGLIGAAFVGDIVLLPCLLVGPLGMIIQHRTTRNQDAESASQRAAVPIPGHHFGKSGRTADTSSYVG